MSEQSTSSSDEHAAFLDLTHMLGQTPGASQAAWATDPTYAALFEKLARVLHRGRPHHALLVAERGVDLDSWIIEFADRASGDWLPFLNDHRVLLVDARFTAPEESRDQLLAILHETAQQPGAVVCINGFASLMKNVQGTNREALLSALGFVKSQIVGFLTPAEYEALFAGDVEAAEFFTRIEIPEPATETALAVLSHFAAALAERYGFTIPADVVRLATTLCSNYILHEKLPGKVRKVLHRICETLDFDRRQLGKQQTEVTAADVIAEVSRASGVPEHTLAGLTDRQDYEASLGEFVVGQDHAVAEVAAELGLIKAGLKEPGQPASVILFMGQTGTGKTELAKALALIYSPSQRLRTYTLGNMVEPHSVSAIIGVPPGYVGHEAGGKIVQDLNADPYCVVLLDESDKAHPDVLQPFLNLFDEGWVRDQRGNEAYANNAIFILTTNVGQRMIADMAKQGKSPEEMADRMKETLSQIKHPKLNRPVFAPEFLARIQRIIVFQPLDEEAMKGICQKLAQSTADAWRTQREKELEFDDELISYIASRAHQRNEKSGGKEGGRLVRKLFRDLVLAPMQRLIARQPEEYRRAERVRVIAAFLPDQSEEGDATPLEVDVQLIAPETALEPTTTV